MLEVGRLGRAHGVRGEIYVDLLTDRTERLAVGARLKAGDIWLTVQAARPAGGRWLVRFEEIPDRTVAEARSGMRLSAEALPESDHEGLYVHELVGASVVGIDGTAYGRCVSVLANPAHDILELDGGALVPVVFIESVDGLGDSRRIVINPPEGLFDL